MTVKVKSNLYVTPENIFPYFLHWCGQWSYNPSISCSLYQECETVHIFVISFVPILMHYPLGSALILNVQFLNVL